MSLWTDTPATCSPLRREARKNRKCFWGNRVPRQETAGAEPREERQSWLLGSAASQWVFFPGRRKEKKVGILSGGQDGSSDPLVTVISHEGTSQDFELECHRA